MTGVLLAGGLGTRLYPVTRVINKHTLLVWDKPMFFHPFETLVKSGIKRVAIVSGPPFGHQIKQFISHLPKKEGLVVTFINQPRPAGMSDGVSRCAKWVGKDSVMAIAGDNYYEDDFLPEVKNFSGGALSFLRKVSDPQRYGVPLYKNGKLVAIKEKPKYPKTNWVVSGPHFFDHQVFSLIRKIKPSARGELEITDLNTEYIKLGQFRLIKKTGWWSDMGTFESLMSTSRFIQKKSL